MIDLMAPFGGRVARACFLCKTPIVAGCVGQIENDFAHYTCVARFLQKAISNG